jgi:hypothetical protein
MKKLLIALLFPAAVFAQDVLEWQISGNIVGFGGGGGGGGPIAVSTINETILEYDDGGGQAMSITTASFTPADDSLLVMSCFFFKSDTGLIANTFSVSGGGLTWTKRVGRGETVAATYGQAAQEIWTAPVTTGASMTVTVSSSGINDDVSDMIVHMLEVTGYDSASPIGATLSESFTGTGSYNATLTATPTSTSVVIGSRSGIVGGANSSAVEGSGWTEAYDSSSVTAGYGELQTQYRTGLTVTTVPWADVDTTDNGFQTDDGRAEIIGIEIKEAP